jgi:protein-tyrosine-phosphatase/DNA-binding transcriptional ArsR family regulator
MSVFRLLARRTPAPLSAGELSDALNLKPSTLSVYLGILTRARLIQQTRHGRSLHYAVDLALTSTLVEYLVHDCCRGRPELLASLMPQSYTDAASTQNKIFNVLFVCAGNSTRSIFAEAILNTMREGQFRAFSAGTKPRDALQPLAAGVLRAKGHDITQCYPKSYDAFFATPALRVDFVSTVCNRAANEEFPPLLGRPVTAHWARSTPARQKAPMQNAPQPLSNVTPRWSGA